MTLNEYRHRHRLSFTELADRLGFPLSTVHGWIMLDRKPDPAVIPLIVERTEGEVTPADLRPDLAALFLPPVERRRAG